MENKTSLRKKHVLASIPYFGPILIMILAFLICGLLGDFLDDTFPVLTKIPFISSVIIAVLFLILYKLWFKPEYKGSFSGKGWNNKMIIPFIVVWALDIIFGCIFGEFSSSAFSLSMVMMSITAGLTEESWFRLIPISLMLRKNNSEKAIIVSLIVSAAVFGLMHLTNAAMGATMGVTLVQVVSTFAAGILFGALYIRSGSILPSMILHGVHDFICFMDVSMTDANGTVIAEVTSRLIISETITAVAEIIIAVYLLRPSVRKEIVQMWNEIWGKDKEEIERNENE